GPRAPRPVTRRGPLLVAAVPTASKRRHVPVREIMSRSSEPPLPPHAARFRTRPVHVDYPRNAAFIRAVRAPWPSVAAQSLSGRKCGPGVSKPATFIDLRSHRTLDVRASGIRVGAHALGGKFMTRSVDVVIVGAGIMGVSTAYHLARRRFGRVVVVERDGVCTGSTALASGGIRHQYGNRIGIELSRHVIATFERFEAEFGVDPHFRQRGYLILVTTEAERDQASTNVALQQSLGVQVDLLSPEETRRRFPYLQTDDLLGATYSPRDGYADPYLVTTAMAARARELGVEIRTGCPVTAVLRPRAPVARLA